MYRHFPFLGLIFLTLLLSTDMPIVPTGFDSYPTIGTRAIDVKTDSIFYRLFQEFPGFFFELIGSSSEEAIDYQFTSQEVKQLSFRIDGLFLPTTDEPEQPFYLVEVQFQPDETLYYRLFSELFLYIKQYQPRSPWQVVVIYPKRSIEREESLQFGEILDLNRVTRIYLDELAGEEGSSLGVKVVKLIVEREDTITGQAKGLVQQAKEELADEKVRESLIELITKIIVYKLPQKTEEEVRAMFELGELEQTQFYQDVKLKGKLEGKLEEKLEAVPRMLRLGLSLEIIAQSLDLPLEVVQQEARKFQQDSGEN